MAWDDLRGYVDQVAYLAYLSGMPGGECLVVCRLEREERRMCSTYLAWGGRRNLASKLLSYFSQPFCPRCWVRMEDVWLGCRQGDCPSPWQPGLSFLVTSRCTS